MTNARILPFTVINPGGRGLNKQASGTLLDPQWCTQAMNCVFDDSGRLASRYGWAKSTSNLVAGNPAFSQVFEYKPIAPSTNVMIMAGNNKLYQGLTTPTDVTGTVTITANNWKFQNFNGNVYGLQASHALIQWTGSGNFTAVTAASGAVPTGNELLGAFGRLWGVNADKQTIVYSALLDATRWATADGGGSINMLSVWPTLDEVVALAAFNGRLVIFGKNNIVVYGDNYGSAIGVNPNNLVVVDAISGVGCAARDSIRNVAGQDVVFLSYLGVQSLNRMMVQRSNPTRNISANIRDYLKGLVNTENPDLIRSAYVPRYGLYLLVFPTAKAIIAFDTKITLEDGTWRVTEWNGLIPTSLWALEDGLTLYQGYNGGLYQYTGNADDTATITIIYLSGWLNLGEQPNNYLKSLKQMTAIVSLSGNITLNFNWAFDFLSTVFSIARSTNYQGGPLYYPDQPNAPSQYGVSQYGSTATLNEYTIPTYGSGQFLQLGISTTITNGQVAIQQIQAFTKLGRLA